MQLSHDNILLNLALDYNNTLLYHSNTISKYANKYGCEHVHRMKIANEIKKKEEHLQQIEDDTIIAMMFRKRKSSENAKQQALSRKRGKCKKRITCFTDPTTGRRSAMACEHTQW